MTLKGDAKTAYMREYMRRRRAGETGKPKPGPKPKQPSDDPDLRSAFTEAATRAQAGRQEEPGSKRPKPPEPPPLPRTREELAEAKRKVTEERRAKRAAAAQPEAKQARKIAELEHKLKQAEARIEQLQNEGTLQQENSRLRQRLATARAEIRMVIKSPNRTVFMAPGDRRKILACLHPDPVKDPAAKKRYEEAFKIFNNLPIKDLPIKEP